MKKVKMFMLMCLVSLVSLTSISQSKVENNDVKFKTELKTFKTEYRNGFYICNLIIDYRYKNIKSGYYTVGFSYDYDRLVTFYEELINISKMDDGEYKLSNKMNNIISIKKSGNRIYFKCLFYSVNDFSAHHRYSKSINFKNLESDLKIIKEEFINHKRYNDEQFRIGKR